MRKRFFVSILTLTIYSAFSRSDSERKLEEGSTNVLTTSWGGSSKKQFLDASYLDLLDATEVEIQLEEGKVSLFSAVPGVPRAVGFFHGQSEGQSANLYKNPETNNVYGSIINSNTNEINQIFTNAIGETEVVTKNVDDFTDDIEEVAMEVPASKKGLFGRKLGFFPMFWSSEERSLNDNDVMDVMVVWTIKAECANSGLSSSCKLTQQTRQNMLGKIELAIDETNTAFALSGINFQLRLVHAYLDYSYSESSNTQALQDITYTSDGNMDDVHEKRERFGADLVSLWVDSSSGCGLGWVGPHKDYMFSVCNWSCATGYFSFGHEIAHNLGCNHDRGTEGNCGTPSPNFGYRDKQSAFRDIMSYNCQGGQCDNIADSSCARVQMFSNTVSNYQGAPIGDANNNCAAHINANAGNVARYFTAKTDEELVKEGQFQQEGVMPTPSPTTSGCKGVGANCSNNLMCCSGSCRWRKCT